MHDTFHLAGRRVITFGTTFIVLGVLASVLGYAAMVALREPQSPTGPNIPAIAAAVAAFLGLAVLFCVVGLFISVIVWLVNAHRLRAAGPGLAGYAILVAGVALMVTSYLVPDRLTPLEAAMAAEMVLRFGGIGALIGAVTLSRSAVLSAATSTAHPAAGASAPHPAAEASAPHPVAGASAPLPVAAEDWGGGWDPDVQAEIDRRRPHSQP
ncbi:hypothetical protein [Actinoplanes sp. NBRC 101535]|uniref:hypothetical protein n=1 Tax=Actinoplanes sp. NBRC 101535 TaxID=3032196 RepID=UPI00249FC7B5|nr:hypothetical protein [Actinoplanes sp. NBRC 101535]GLY01258.1 hypothetical protein Acsp01_16370 [Actinoplanes sp. NBRC 101535]